MVISHNITGPGPILAHQTEPHKAINIYFTFLEHFGISSVFRYFINRTFFVFNVNYPSCHGLTRRRFYSFSQTGYGAIKTRLY